MFKTCEIITCSGVLLGISDVSSRDPLEFIDKLIPPTEFNIQDPKSLDMRTAASSSYIFDYSCIPQVLADI